MNLTRRWVGLSLWIQGEWKGWEAPRGESRKAGSPTWPDALEHWENLVPVSTCTGVGVAVRGCEAPRLHARDSSGPVVQARRVSVLRPRPQEASPTLSLRVLPPGCLDSATDALDQRGRTVSTGKITVSKQTPY